MSLPSTPATILASPQLAAFTVKSGMQPLTFSMLRVLVQSLDGLMTTSSFISLLSTVHHTISSVSVGMPLSCKMGVAASQAASSGTKVKACLTTHQLSLMRMWLVPSWTTRPSLTTHILTLSSLIAMQTSTSFSARHGFTNPHGYLGTGMAGTVFTQVRVQVKVECPMGYP